MPEIRLRLTEPQEQFVFTDAPHPAMIAGFGAGKSQAAIIRLALKALAYPGLNFGFVEPTFDLIRLIAWPRFCQFFDDFGIGYEANKTDGIIKLENDAQIIFRSADTPERLVGFEIADGVIDEIDTLKHAHAAQVWIKMLGRCRQVKPDRAINTLAAVSTPEGFKFVYNTWGREAKPGYELIKAPTSSNPFLPAGYIDQLKAIYPSSLLAAYLDGEFVNLTAGSVYHEFDRKLNGCSLDIQPNEPLHIGIDFNVNNMSAIVCVIRGGDPIAMEEVTKVRDTPTMIDVLRSRYPGHSVTVYPDASGKSTKSVNASISDISLLRSANFTVLANPANPAVKDRVMAVNQLIHANGVRRLLVNFDKCPTLVEGLEQQSYDKNGEPDKSSGHDHLNDALGYFLCYKFGINRGTVSFAKLSGV